MAEVLIFPPARDSNDDPRVGEAYFYIAGTDTLQTVYADQAGTTAVSSPLVSDANGNFAQVFNTSANQIRTVVRDQALGPVLSELAVTPAVALTTQAASGVSFAPTSDIPDTNIQDAIEQVQTNWTAAKTGADSGIVSGTAGAANALAEWNSDGDLIGTTKTLSGADGTLVTGTAGTSTYTAVWNADGDLVDGFDPATKATAWTWLAEVATTSGTAFDSVIAATATEIIVLLDAVSLSASDNFLIQLGTGSTPTTTGYAASCSSSPFTTGFGMLGGGAASVMSGTAKFYKTTSDVWIGEVVGDRGSGNNLTGAGRISLAGAVDILRLTRDGTDTFDAGQVVVGYR